MHQFDEFVDERLKGVCIHCGEWPEPHDINRDHVPSKCLLKKPYPDNLPVVEICKSCNTGFSLDEEYFIAILGAALVGSTEPDRQICPTAADIFLRDERLQARVEGAKIENRTLFGEVETLWAPEQDRIDRIILKNARGHAYFELGEPIHGEPTHVGAIPLARLDEETRLAFENVACNSIWPEVGSRGLTRMATGADLLGGWVNVQDGVYRYAVIQQAGPTTVRTVLYESLATEVHWD